MKKVRMTIDILMVVFLPLLMAYSLIGEKTHEILGICMFALFIAHHIINRKWWTTISEGRYSAARVLNMAVNLLLAVFMILQPVSGILMSKYVFKSVSISGMSGSLRTLHMTLAYWGFLLMSFHLGLHVRTISAKIRSRMSKAAGTGIAAAFGLISAYGVYAFLKRGIGGYMLMKTRFAFFDFSEPRIFFLLDYITVIVLAAEIAFFVQGALITIGKKRRRS